MSGKLYINGSDLTGSTYGLRIGGVRTYQGRSDESRGVLVPGRIGEVMPDKTTTIGGLSYPDWPDGFPNELREYKAALYLRNASAATVEKKLAALRWMLLNPFGGYKTLKDSYEPSFYRLAVFSGDFVPERKGAGQNFEFPLTFSCDPRRFFLVPDIAITGTTHYLTPTDSGISGFTVDMLAKPVIKVVGNDAQMVIRFLTVQTSEEYGRITMAPFTGTAIIDCNDLVARGSYTVTGGGPLITAISGEPCLLPTGCKFHRSSGSASVTVTPRWWVR